VHAFPIAKSKVVCVGVYVWWGIIDFDTQSQEKDYGIEIQKLEDKSPKNQKKKNQKFWATSDLINNCFTLGARWLLRWLVCVCV
jgi:hypothetical protein